MNPTQLKWIYLANQTDPRPAKYKTWTQIAYLQEWPPATSAVFFWWKETNTIIVGCNYDEHCVEALRDWRIKYSINKIAGRSHKNWKNIDEKNATYEAWKDMYLNQGMRQSDIARKLGVSPAYCSNMKKKYEWGAVEVE